MGRVKPCRDNNKREESIRLAKQDFINGIEPSIRSAARTYDVPYTTLRDRLHGLQTRTEAHQELQLLSVQEEKAIVRFCETLDDWGHPVTIKILKQFAQSLLPEQQRLGKHWTGRFLKRNPAITAKSSHRLDKQRENANDPIILKDYFCKVSNLRVPSIASSQPEVDHSASLESLFVHIMSPHQIFTTWMRRDLCWDRH